MVTFDEEKQGRQIEELHHKEAEALAVVLGQKYALPYLDLTKTAINTDALRLVPESEARAATLAPFRVVGRQLDLAILTPHNNRLEEIEASLKDKNFVVNRYLVSETSLEHAWERYAEIGRSTRTDAGVISISDEEIAGYISTFKNIADIRAKVGEEEQESLEGGNISSLLEVMLSGALTTNASDIHIEPQEDGIRLRYRLDGVLHDIAQFDPRVYRQIVSRIKLVSGLKLNVKQTSQDGRFSIKVQDTEIEIRTSLIPGAYGESIVLRILNPKSIAVTFENLGVDPELYQIFEQEITKPNGLILLTGPTGSGKTTTLYSFLRRVSSSENKIITIEDPIEYHLEGVNQTQVNRDKGYTFLSGLRAALRQDPDIIMVGEIRDAETAKIAINSALTGHLVFSTLHTNNAAGAIPRLIDLGANPKVLTSALTTSIAQRLVRRLCPDCKQATTPTSDEQTIIDRTLETIAQKKPDLPRPPATQIWRAGACEACNQTGYRGRVAVFEAVLMNDAIKKVTIENPDEKEIKIAARTQGILDMRQDGILKVLTGVTDIAELGRVVDLHEEFI